MRWLLSTLFLLSTIRPSEAGPASVGVVAEVVESWSMQQVDGMARPIPGGGRVSHAAFEFADMRLPLLVTARPSSDALTIVDLSANAERPDSRESVVVGPGHDRLEVHFRLQTPEPARLIIEIAPMLGG